MTVPDDVKAYREGVRLFKQGKLLEALARFKFAAETGEDRPMEHFALASAYMQVRDLGGAETEYRRFLGMNPDSPPQEHAAHKALAKIEQKKREAEGTRRTREEAERKKRLERVRKLYDEAVAYFRSGGYSSALERLDTLADTWGRTPEVLNLMGLCHKRMGDSVAALAVLEEAHASAPDNADVMLNLALTHFESGVERALELIRKVTAARPENPQAWYNLGAVALAAGEYEEAEKAWRRNLAIEPDDRLAKANLEMIRRRQHE